MFTKHSRLNFSEGVQEKLFLVTPNLRPKNFLEFSHLQSAVDCEFFAGRVWAPTFFGHSKFEVKKFSEFFHLPSALDSEFFTVRGSGH